MTTNNIEIDIINEIRALAGANYDKGYGWQIIVECMSDDDILAQCGDTHDMKVALRNISDFVEIQSEHYDEITATEW